MCVQSYPALCSPVDKSPPGFSVCGFSKQRVLGWVAIAPSRGSSGTQGSNLPGLLYWAGGFFTTSTAREARLSYYQQKRRIIIIKKGRRGKKEDNILYLQPLSVSLVLLHNVTLSLAKHKDLILNFQSRMHQRGSTG